MIGYNFVIVANDSAILNHGAINKAILKFSTDKRLYLPQVLTCWEGNDCYNYHPFIYAYGETNIAITGKGHIDGLPSNDRVYDVHVSNCVFNGVKEVHFNSLIINGAVVGN